MQKRIDLKGQTFGKLTVISYAGTNKRGRAMWNCICECGRNTTPSGSDLISGHTKSCGCSRHGEHNKKSKKHGGRNTRLYRIWHGMKTRIKNTNCKSWKDYGGRGIEVCEEWDSFENFRDWAIENGYKDNLTLDRIDNNGNYNPENCRWITQKENDRNKRNNKILEYRGEKKTIAEWAEYANISYSTLKTRLRKGMSITEAIETPIKK